MDPGDGERDRQVLRVIGIEGAANGVVLLAKVVVGLATGSFAILAEALHSLTDLSNNVVAFFIVRLSAKPPTGSTRTVTAASRPWPCSSWRPSSPCWRSSSRSARGNARPAPWRPAASIWPSCSGCSP